MGPTPHVPTYAGASGSGRSGQRQDETEIQCACGTPALPARRDLGPEMLVQLERPARELLGRECPGQRSQGAFDVGKGLAEFRLQIALDAFR